VDVVPASELEDIEAKLEEEPSYPAAWEPKISDYVIPNGNATLSSADRSAAVGSIISTFFFLGAATFL